MAGRVSIKGEKERERDGTLPAATCVWFESSCCDWPSPFIRRMCSAQTHADIAAAAAAAANAPYGPPSSLFHAGPSPPQLHFDNQSRAGPGPKYDPLGRNSLFLFK